MDVKYEGSTITLNLTFRDSAGQTAEPSSVSWAAYDGTTGEELRPLTAAEEELASTMQVKVPYEYTLIDSDEGGKVLRFEITAVLSDGDNVSKVIFVAINPLGSLNTPVPS